jgi:hypothetical protein
MFGGKEIIHENLISQQKFQLLEILVLVFTIPRYKGVLRRFGLSGESCSVVRLLQ